MYKEILSRRQHKEQSPHNHRSKKLLAYEFSLPISQVSPERFISPWESQEVSNKIQNISRQQHFKNLPEQKRSLQLKQLNQTHYYSKYQERKGYAKISKDFLLFLKKQKQKSQLQNRNSPFYRNRKISKIQMSLNDQKTHDIDYGSTRSQSVYFHPESRQLHKDLPTKVKIHKKLIEDHRKKAQQGDSLYAERDYKTIRVFPSHKSANKNDKKKADELKEKKQKLSSNKYDKQTKFTLQDFYKLDPLFCKGDIISHEQSKVTRKFRFRNNIASQLNKLDPQTFLYKI